MGITATTSEYCTDVIAGDPSGWSFLDKLDKKKEKAKEAATGGVAAARALFQNKASRGQDSSSDGDKLWTAHEGTISDMALVSPSVVSTAALDGRVVLWNLPQLHIAMASMGL